MQLEIIDSLSGIDAQEWDALVEGNPFLSHAFLHALHQSGCAAPRTGWTPVYLTLRRERELVGALPLYLKAHSRGEYVFDQGWAEAFRRHGLAYYPKLLSAVPFTPVGGPRLLARTPEHRRQLIEGALDLARRSGVSSLHVLFPDERDREALAHAGFMLREGVQFHWQNQSYADFDGYLGAMSHDKRKKIRQDRRRVKDAGVVFRVLHGDAIAESDLRFFFDCYVGTYRNHGSPPYLTLAFFEQLRRTLAEQLVLITASIDEQPIASAFNVWAGDTLYGRYWGATRFVSGLHFETCYSQAIEFCIRHGIARFEGGAQGLHKLARGLLPKLTWSAHWIADPRFAEAIEDFLREETQAMTEYLDELEEHTPFKEHPDPA